MTIKYVNQKSLKHVINQFADFIVNTINKDGDYKSEIHVHFFKKFVVINGVTTSKKLLSMFDLKKEFLEKNREILNDEMVRLVGNFNIIDTIQYNHHPLTVPIFNFNYYNSERPLYHKEVINFVNQNDMNPIVNTIHYSDCLEIEHYDGVTKNFEMDYFTYLSSDVCSSSFPHGYSDDIGRTPLFYGEYVCNHLFNLLNTDKILLKFSIYRNGVIDDNYVFIQTNTNYKEEDVKSLILDVFNFDLTKFKYDYMKDELLDLDFNTKKWLIKDKSKDMIIV